MPLSNSLCKVSLICRSSFNGAHFSMCEMPKKARQWDRICQDKTNDQQRWLATSNNMKNNNMGMRHVELCSIHNKLRIRESRSFQCGMCSSHCLMNHNLHLNLSMLPMYFRSRVDDMIHWPRQNYECGPFQ